HSLPTRRSSDLLESVRSNRFDRRPVDGPPFASTMTTPTITRAQATTWRNALFVVFCLCGLGMASWMARMPAVKDALGASTADLGILILFLALGWIAGLLASGRAIALVGPGPIMAWALGLGPLGIVVAAFGVTLGPAGFWVVAGGLCFFGAALSVADVAMNLSGAINER